MYSAPYGYPNAAGNPAFNGAPPPQNAHLQPGPSPNQPQQQMMFNGQQFPMAGQGNPFPSGPNQGMMGGAGPAGMMQNAAMPHMAANGQMAFQGPAYTASPYGAAIPSSAAPQPQLPANYMMAGPMGQFQMNPGMPPQQQMMQRMHPSQQNPASMSVATPQRPFNPAAQGTPNNAIASQQGQFSSPQPQNTPQPSQTPTNVPQPSGVQTPQTPTFPSMGQATPANGASVVTTPQSPGAEARDKERFAVMLSINGELLYETIQLINCRAELKKEQVAVESGEAKPTGVDYGEEMSLLNQDYTHCMRRLQTNLAYMAPLADRKPNAQIPPHPQFLTAPPLNLNIKLRVPQTPAEDGQERPANPVQDRAERDKLLKDLYKKLQALYPGVDPRKEPSLQPAGPRPGAAQHNNQAAAMKTQNGQPSAMGSAGGQGSNHSSPTPMGAPSQKTPQMANTAAPVMQGMATMPGMQGMQQGMSGMPNMHSMPGMQGIHGGMQNMQNMQGMQGMQGIPGVPGVPGMQGMPNIQNMQHMQNVQAMQNMQGLQGMPGMHGVPGQMMG